MPKKILLKQKKYLTILVIFISIVFLLNIGATIYLLVQNQNLNYKYVPRLSYDLIRAIDSSDKPAVIDPISDNVYFPEAKIVLPPTSYRIVYGFIPGSESQKVLLISNQSDIVQSQAGIQNGLTLKAIFDSISKAQDCARGISIYFQPDSGQKLIFSKKLNNGESIYIYSDSLTCSDTDFLNYVETLNSY